MKRLVRWTVPFGIAVVCCAVGAWQFTRSCLQKQEDAFRKTFFTLHGDLLQYAYRMQDDLFLQRWIQSASRLSEVERVTLARPDGVIWMDSDWSMVGKQMSMDSPASCLQWTAPLETSGERWGVLQLQWSRCNREARLQSWIWMLAGSALVLVLWFGTGLTQFQFRLHQALRKEKDAYEAADVQHREMQRLQKECDSQLKTLRDCLDAALDQIARPVLLLDERQRLLGMNPLCVTGWAFKETPRVGCFWNDVAPLASLGASLQQSLEAPGQLIETLDVNARRVFLITKHGPSSSSIHTWVYL